MSVTIMFSPGSERCPSWPHQGRIMATLLVPSDVTAPVLEPTMECQVMAAIQCPGDQQHEAMQRIRRVTLHMTIVVHPEAMKPQASVTMRRQILWGCWLTPIRPPLSLCCGASLTSSSKWHVLIIGLVQAVLHKMQNPGSHNGPWLGGPSQFWLVCQSIICSEH